MPAFVGVPKTTLPLCLMTVRGTTIPASRWSQAKAMERSSSNIREALKSGASIQGEVHDTVADMLHNKGHYTQE